MSNSRWRMEADGSKEVVDRVGEGSDEDFAGSDTGRLSGDDRGRLHSVDDVRPIVELRLIAGDRLQLGIKCFTDVYRQVVRSPVQDRRLERQSEVQVPADRVHGKAVEVLVPFG